MIGRRNAVGIIPARLGSTRFPHKLLAPLAGIPVILRVARQAQKSRTLTRLVVATDSEEIRELLIADGVEVVMTAADHLSGTDRVAEAAASISAEVIVNVQGDEPFIEPEVIDAVAAPFFLRPDVEMATAAGPPPTEEEWSNPNRVKVAIDPDGFAADFFRAGSPNGTRNVRTHVGLYAYLKPRLLSFAATPPSRREKEQSLEQLRALDAGIRIFVAQTQYRGFGIDTPKDLKRAEEMLANAEAAH